MGNNSVSNRIKYLYENDKENILLDYNKQQFRLDELIQYIKNYKVTKINGSTIIIDIDETLVETEEIDEYSVLPTQITHICEYITFDTCDGTKKYISFKRNYINLFRDFCEKRYDTCIIWSASTDEYAHKISKLLGFHQDKWYVFGRTHTTNKFNKHPSVLPKEITNKIDITKTWFIDDRKHRHWLNCNYINVPSFILSFNQEDKIAFDDTFLFIMYNWINGIEVPKFETPYFTLDLTLAYYH